MAPRCVASTNPNLNFCVVVAQNGGVVVRLSGRLDFMPNNRMDLYVEGRPSIRPCAVTSFLKRMRGITLQQAMELVNDARW